LQGTAELQDWARHTAAPEETGEKNDAGVAKASANDSLELDEMAAKPAAVNGDTEKCDIR
jgi:hypothetical protein